MKKGGEISLFSFLFFFHSVFFMSIFVWANDVEVFAHVNRNKLSLKDRVQLTVSVSSSKSISLEKPKLPELRSFNLLSLWESSEATSQFTQGSFTTTQIQKFHYLLEPKRTGKIKIGAFKVKVGGDILKTKPIEIEVAATTHDSANRPSDQQRGGGVDSMDKAEEDLFSNFFGKTSPQKPPSEDAFFVQAFYDKKVVFEGEQLLVSWFIYTRENIGDIDTISYPNFKGFWKEDINRATQLSLKNEVINGIVYKKAKIATYALFPLSPGKAVIEPYTIKALLVRPSSFVFGRGRSYQVTKSSDPIEIEVLPLPKENRPKGFSKAVGDFSMIAQLDANEVPVDQPVSLNIRYQGYGNAKLMDLPSNVDLPDSIEHYDTRKEAKFFKDGKSYKNFELILIPRKEGVFEIPSFRLSAFNPKTKEYYTENTSSLKIKVLPQKGQSKVDSIALQENDPGQSKIQSEKDRQFKPIIKWKKPFYSSYSFGFKLNLFHWLALYSLFLSLFLMIQISRVLRGRKQGGLKKFLVSSIKKIRKKAQQRDFRNVGVYGTNTIYYVLGHVSGQGGAHLKIDELLNKTPPSLRKKIERPIRDLMKKFEILSFAPKELFGDLESKEEMNKMIREMEKILKVLNQEALKKQEVMDFLNSRSQRKTFLFLFFILNLLFFYNTHAFNENPLKLSIKDQWDVPRQWTQGRGEQLKMGKIKDQTIKKLYLVRKSLSEENYALCLKYVHQLNVKILEPWLLGVELECTKKREMRKKGKTNFLLLREVLLKFKRKRADFKDQQRLPKFFYQNYIDALIFYIQEEEKRQSFLKSLRKSVQIFIDELQSLEQRMNRRQKADFFFLLANSLSKEKNFSGARDFLTKSLSYRDSKQAREALREVLKKIRSARELSSQRKRALIDQEVKLPPLDLNRKGKKRGSPFFDIQKEIKKESNFYSKVKAAFNKSQKMKTIQEGVKFLRLYPGGRYTESVSDLVFKVYFKFTKNRLKGSPLKRQALTQMGRVNGEILYSWAFKFYRMQSYKEAYLFGEKSFNKLKRRVGILQVLRVLAKSHFYLGNFSKAKFYLKKLFFEYSGTSEAKEALFLLGLIQFKNKNYQQSSAYLRGLSELHSNYNLEAHYWLWRSLERLNDKSGALKVAEVLVKKYPLTYYGLRAKAELNQGVFKWEVEEPSSLRSIEVRIWMTEFKRNSWKRFKLFLLSGWFEEAKEELEILSSDSKSQKEKVIWAKFWGLAFNYHKAISILTQAIQEDKDLLRLSVLRYAYPNEFVDLIQKESKKNGIDPLLVQSVIRQESSFQVRAKSSANAMGLMQLVPVTAWEQANLLKREIKSNDDFFNPSINISLGTNYLKRMIRAFNGHVPLALAAYNAGIGNIRRWQKNRVDLKNIEFNHSTQFENEIWIDEMPWDETRDYVKSVLRHFLIYKMLERKELEWNPTFWSKKQKRAL